MGGGGVAAGSGGGVTSKAGVGILANLKQGISGWRDMLTNLGNVGFKPERWSMDEAGDMIKIADAKGIGGMKGGALLAAGAMLAMDGLRRGGRLRRRNGAAVHQRSGREGSPEDQGSVRVDIPDNAKQSYGGNLEMAIRTQQIRDLIQLYAVSTGQATKGTPAPAWRGCERHREQPARRSGRFHERGAIERRPARVDQPPVESGTAHGLARSTRRAAAYPRVSSRSGGPAWLHLTLDERG